MIKVADTDGDGRVNFHDFLSIVEPGYVPPE